MLDDLGVGHAPDARQRGHCAVEGPGGEVADGERLIVREAGLAELLVRRVKQVLRGGVRCGMHEIAGQPRLSEAAKQFGVDRGGGFAVQLLVDDGFEQSFKGREGAGQFQRERSCPLDQPAQPGVGLRELPESEGGIVSRGTRTLESSRHVLAAYRSEPGWKGQGVFSSR